MIRKRFTPLFGILLLLWLAATAATVRAGDGTVAGSATVSLRSSTWVAAQVPFAGDDNVNGHTLYEIGTSASGPFSASGAWYERLSGPQEWRANVFHVSPSTTYYVRITFVDPDGVTGTNPQIIGPVTTPASAPNTVTVETASAVLHNAEIYVSIDISNDANKNSGGVIEIATDAAGPWTSKAGSLSEANLPFNPKRARLRGLTPGTNYWVRVTITDPDGVIGSNPQVLGPINYTGLQNLALGKSITASPGWGCCPSPSHLVDGRIQNDAWFFGFAWTGGTSCFAGGCPAGLNKHATVDLGAPTQFNSAVMWHHDPGSVPVVWKIQYSDDGVNFTDAYSNNQPICRTATDPIPGAWYHPGCGHEAKFSPITARYVRYLFDDSTLFGGIHGWAVEFEVFNATCEPALTDTGTFVTVGAAPSQAIITPTGAEVYVSNNGDNTVSVISTTTNTVTHTVPVGSGPDALAVAPDGSQVYVGQHGGGVSVIDTATKNVTSINTLGGPVRDLAITPNGSKVYLAMEFAGLRVIDTATNNVTNVSGFACPEGVRVTPDGATVYVNYQCGGPGGSGGHDAVGRFDAATGAFLGSTTGLPNVGSGLTISPDGAQVWENGGDACISPFYDHAGCSFVPAGVVNVLSTATNTLQQSIGFNGFSPGLISFFPDSSRAVIGSSPSLLIFDTTAFGVVDTLAVPGSGSVAFALNGQAYAPVPGQNQVAILQLSCQTLPTPIFSDLSSPTIIYGTPETTLSGRISGSAGAPTGDIEITLMGVTLLAPIQSDGSFSATFGTATLGGGTHTVGYHYGGDALYAAADANSIVTVLKAKPKLEVFGGTFAFDGQPHSATGSASGVNGEDLGSLSFSYNGSASPPVAIGAYAVSATFAGDANYEPASNNATSIYINPGAPAEGDLGTYWVTNLGTLGGLTSTGTAVNASGQVVGYSETAAGETHAFLFSGGAMTDLGTLGGTYSVATGINASGQVVGYSQTSAGVFRAFIYTSGTMQPLPTLGGADGFTYAINDSGVVVGEAQTASGDFHAFSFSAGSITDLGVLMGGLYSAANAINASGQIAGYAQGADAFDHAFLYMGGVMTDLGALDGDAAGVGTSINDAGRVAGYSFSASGAAHAFLYDGQMHDLGVLSQSSNFSRALSINNGGEVVGHSITDLSESHGFVFDGTKGLRDLNVLIPAGSGVLFNTANGINVGGQIAGAGDDAGQTLALLLTPVQATTTSVADVITTYSDNAQQVSLTATVQASGGATVDEGTVTFQVRRNGTDIGTAVTSPALTNGIAIVSYTLPAGTGARNYTIRATYNDGPKFTGSTGTGTLTVQNAATSTALTSSVNPSVFGQPVTFTATVTSAAGMPAGNVQFKDGNQAIGTAALAGGVATLTRSNLAAGAHSITAVYVGNSNFDTSTSPVLTQTVNKAATSTSITSSANPSVFGQSVTFTATVNVVAPGAGRPTGDLQFFNGATLLSTQPLGAGGRASFTTPALAFGIHTITARYIGNANFDPSNSAVLTQTVNKAATRTTVSGPASSVVGQPVTFTATVVPLAPGAGMTTGLVQFKINGANAPGGLQTLVNGQATYTTNSLGVGNHIISAQYQGAGNFNPSNGSLNHRRR